MIGATFKVDDAATPLLDALLRRLGDAGRRELYGAATHGVAVLVRAHILDAAKTRHRTADTIRFGPADRSNHLIKAGESVAESYTSSEGMVSVYSPGFRRALGPLTILPRERENLTIPVHAYAYNRRVGEIVRDGVKVFRPRGKNYLATRDERITGGAFRILFILVKSATLKHEPELLPRIEEMQDAGKKEVATLIKDILRKAAR